MSDAARMTTLSAQLLRAAAALSDAATFAHVEAGLGDEEARAVSGHAQHADAARRMATLALDVMDAQVARDPVGVDPTLGPDDAAAVGETVTRSLREAAVHLRLAVSHIAGGEAAALPLGGDLADLAADLEAESDVRAS